MAARDGFNALQAEWRIVIFHDRNDGEANQVPVWDQGRTTDADPYGQRNKVGYSCSRDICINDGAVVCAIALIVLAYDNRRSKLTRKFRQSIHAERTGSPSQRQEGRGRQWQ